LAGHAAKCMGGAAAARKPPPSWHSSRAPSPIERTFKQSVSPRQAWSGRAGVVAGVDQLAAHGQDRGRGASDQGAFQSQVPCVQQDAYLGDTIRHENCCPGSRRPSRCHWRTSIEVQDLQVIRPPRAGRAIKSLRSNYRNQLANVDAANRAQRQNPRCLLVSAAVFYYFPAIFLE
jgi:hypothetical protein